MPTVIEHKIDNTPVVPYKDFNPTIVATYGLNVQPALEIEDIIFANVNGSSNSTLVRQSFQNNPAEGGTYSMTVSNGTISYPFDFYFDYSKMIELNPSETQIGLVKDRSLDSLIDYNGEDVTMQLLVYKGFITPVDYVNIPYVVKSRESVIKKAVLGLQIFTLVKSFYDEFHKMLNIISDLPTGGGAVAIVNLALTLTNLGLMIDRLIQLIKEFVEIVYPQGKYHSAIPLKTCIEKGLEYLGYEVDFGLYWTELDGIILMPNKDKEGKTSPITSFTQPGIPKAKEFCYTLKGCFEMCRKLANTQEFIIGNTVHIRPKMDPFWTTNSGFTMASVKIGSGLFNDNGTKRYNYEDLKAVKTYEYVYDDSDYWTISNLANNQEGATSVVASVSPLNTVEVRRSNIRGTEVNTTPYALCVRNDIAEDFKDLISQMLGEFDALQDELESIFDTYQTSLGSFPLLNQVFDNITKPGYLKVENDFFSTPKIIYTTKGEDGLYSIPSNYDEKIGKKAIYERYFRYDSMVAGIRNPDNTSDTNAKGIYTDVKIPMTLENFNLLLNNSYFNSEYGTGKFTKIAWSIKEDTALCDFWLQEDWVKNVEEIITT